MAELTIIFETILTSSYLTV